MSRSGRRTNCAFSALLGLVTALVLAGCGSSSESSDKVLQRGNGGAPGTLDPLLAEDVHAFRVLGDLFEGLVVANARGEIVPGVAESWSVSEDGLTWRFELRADARWSDGSMVVAGDFVRSLERLASPDVDSSYEFLLSPLRGFDERNGGGQGAALGVQALGERTLLMTLNSPTPYWLSVLTMTVAMPTPPGDAPLYNGAYVLEDERVNAAITLGKNAMYWDYERVALDKVIYHSIVDPTSEFNAFLAGDLHIAVNPPAQAIQTLRAERPDQLRLAPKLGLYYLAFDLTEAPLNSTAVRQALTMAVDRGELTELLGRGEQPALGVVPEGIPGYTPARFDWSDQPVAERRQAARALLEAAGYSDDRPLKLTLIYDSGDIHERIALIVSDMWRELGMVAPKLVGREWQFFLETRDLRADWDSMRFAWIGDYNDPTTFLDLFHSGNVQNLPGYTDVQYDDLLAAAVIADPETRSGQLALAEQKLIHDYPIAPLYFYVSKHLVQPGVQGFEANALDRHLSKYLSLDGATRSRE